MNETTKNTLETALASEHSALTQAIQRKQEITNDLSMQDATIAIHQQRISDLEASLESE